MKKSSRFLEFLFVALLLLGIIKVSPVLSLPTTKVYLDPSSYIFTIDTVSAGYKFNVTVRVEDVEDCAMFQVTMFYNDTIINVTRWFEPKDDLEYIFKGKNTLPVPQPPNIEFNQISPGNASVTVGSAVFEFPPTGVTGDGKLCILEFNVTEVPPLGETYSCMLDIDNRDTFLQDSLGEDIDTIKENGYYELSGGAPPEPEPPAANFTWFPTKPQENQTVTFDASVSTADGGFIISYVWDFGDGTNGTGEIITHNYTNAGTYMVILNVTDNEGLWDIESKSITIRLPRTTDVNGDGKIDFGDIIIVIKAFGSYPDHPRWNSAADVDGDERVDIRDIFYIILDWTST